ncbi:hypothetical protein OKW41_000341 [Paraburkholderia sp. UCT70]|uniref:hypothetical protein n=1 Tax=Paraburkholderia sp. UCT70 TaxID=2991068 RepID=UPI003D2410E0
MAKTGWDIAMRNIDAELDLPQFEASTLVRKVAANNFQLPTADRAKFERLPDEVIARIEQIVRDAYLAAGEDVSGESLREYREQQAVAGRREMIANGELVAPTDFKKRIGISEKRLAALLNDGGVFTVEVDEVSYIPALLAEPAHNRKRLQAICRIIATAPPISRLDFLTSRRGSLGDRSPLEMLESDDDFKSLRRLAAAWAAEWSRTAVKLFKGDCEIAPKDVEPLYTAAAEIDPRKPL